MQPDSETNKDSLEQRIARRAHRIWEEEGRPDGRDKEHWDKAAELVAIEDNYMSTLKPVERDSDDPEIAAVSAEPPEAANTGELPTLTDAGEQVYPPSYTPEDQSAPGNGSDGAGSGRMLSEDSATWGRRSS